MSSLDLGFAGLGIQSRQCENAHPKVLWVSDVFAIVASHPAYIRQIGVISRKYQTRQESRSLLPHLHQSAFLDRKASELQ